MNDLFSSEPLYETPPDIRTYKLTRLDLYNWGGFAGRHSVDIDPRGTAIIGPTGAGKTTLVDALMTLLTEQPKYNLASTGGHESDRDLVSYVRGVSGAGTSDGSNAHIARSGRTLTGISATFSDGQIPVTIGALFWLDGTGSGASDLGRLWIFSTATGHSLDTWLESHHGGGTRRLKQLRSDTAGLEMWDSKKSYVSRLRSFFDVGENAFTLLNRAAGLKQLSSIDEIFRELVLDDCSAFDRAAQVSREFDDLHAIHNELEVARRQVLSLQPVRSSASQRNDLIESLKVSRTVRILLPTWFAEHAHRRWSQQEDVISVSIKKFTDQQESIKAELAAATQEKEHRHAVYLRAGGSDAEHLREHIASEQRRVNEISRRAEDYRRLTQRLGLDQTPSESAFQANQEQAGLLKESLTSDLALKEEHTTACAAKEHRLREQQHQFVEELRDAKARPHSNIPQKFHNFRGSLAEHLQLPESDLPFLAELIEVKQSETAWRGAIERAIGGHRSRILVPSSAMKSALRWINSRDNGLHVRLLDVVDRTTAPRFMDDGFTHKLKFQTHPYREAVKHLLAENDRHCVESSDALHGTAHAMTAEGLMSGARGQFDKQDQTPLNRDWWTGFDNRDRLAQLQDAVNDVERKLTASIDEHRRSKVQRDEINQKIYLVDALIRLLFSEIDHAGALLNLRTLEDRLAHLTDPTSDAGQAEAAWREANSHAEKIQQYLDENRLSLGTQTNELRHTQENRERTLKRIGDGLNDEQRLLLSGHLPGLDEVALNDLIDTERRLADHWDERISKQGTELGSCEKEIIRHMGAARQLDTGALAETGTEMRDIPAYLERLRILEQEDLPAKLHRFQDYLNHSSDQGVTQLLADIDNEVSIIEERIEDLNNTLSRVDFSAGHFLRLDPKRITHESLTTLQKEIRMLHSARLKDDQGESHFKALQSVVSLLRDASERRRVTGSLALLDPRYRLRFAVSVIDRESRAVIETRTDSRGGSGGEKEIIASHVLTASLSYALCPAGSSRPLFGTVVLDEAFSRSSHTVAGRIISALTEFGLHPLFVTPNKELRLLRSHTRSAILVHRRGTVSGMMSLSWEELDKHVASRVEITP